MMKMKIIGNLVQFRRQLHTIVSKDVIKPSSPTPSQLKTYNLSLIDQIMANLFMPMVTFYPNTGISSDKTTLDLKNSLSKTLTKYYPFAGRHAKVAPFFVDCNDNGAHFLQVNHFECGGVAIAVSLSHKIADGNSLLHFMKDWAKITRFCSTDQQKHEFSIVPEFIHFQYMNINSMGLNLERSNDCVTRTFTFPNSKINELKAKVKSITEESGNPITNPTRVEVLTWLIYTCAVAAATKSNSGAFKPTGIGHVINLRSHMMEKLPEKTIGNFILPMEIFTKNETELNPMTFITELRKQKLRFQALKNIEAAFGILLNTDVEEHLRKPVGVYICSSLCGNSAYDIDFGWGNPIKAATAGYLKKNSFILMDTPNGNGIEAFVSLGIHDMAIVQSDPQLLDFC